MRDPTAFPAAGPACPLCGAAGSGAFFEDRRRSYSRCAICGLVFVPPRHFVSPEKEKARYDQHHNDPYDEGYRRFLARLSAPLLGRLAPGSHGLDFGCGPGPALALMLEEAGHVMTLYDPYYAADPVALEKCYDFITASEVFEHLHRPGEELERLWGCLKPGGLLGVMTGLVRDRVAFARWHYINDPTHVCFFSRATFSWLAARWRAGLSFEGDNVILLEKTGAA